MIDSLLNHIRKFTVLTTEEEKKVSSCFIYREFKKRDYILQPGFVSKYECFIVKGCIRAFVIDLKGNDCNVRFGIEKSWVGDLDSFFKEKPATYYIQALEDTNLLMIDKNNLNELTSTIQGFEHYFRMMFQYGVMSLQSRLIHELSYTAEQRYLHFAERYPHLLQRIPQKHIASYLGMTPEFLSALRKKLARK